MLSEQMEAHTPSPPPHNKPRTKQAQQHLNHPVSQPSPTYDTPPISYSLVPQPNLHPPIRPPNLSLATPPPHALQQPNPLRHPVKAIVALAHRAHEAAERVHLVLARVPAVLVHFADGDLHAGVVFGFDDAVRRAAFAGDVAVRPLGLVGGHWGVKERKGGEKETEEDMEVGG